MITPAMYLDLADDAKLRQVFKIAQRVNLQLIDGLERRASVVAVDCCHDHDDTCEETFNLVLRRFAELKWNIVRADKHTALFYLPVLS